MRRGRPASSSLGRMLEGMKSMAASPYGFWTSPITSDLVVADSRGLEQVALDGDAIYWTETRPQKQGRAFVYRIGAGADPERVTPDDANVFSVRTRAHEYGGGAFAVSEGAIYFSNNIDQRYNGAIETPRSGLRLSGCRAAPSRQRAQPWSAPRSSGARPAPSGPPPARWPQACRPLRT
jgi:hypothetical protein